MKTLGVISGMGTRAGIFFINKLISRLDVKRDQDFPEFFLHNNSRIPDRTRAIVYNEASPVAELQRSIAMMNECKVEVVVSTCVTAYYFIERIKNESTAIVLNPVNLIRDLILREHPEKKSVGLLCTSGTLRSKLFHKAFEGTGHQLITLDADKQENVFMRSVYMENGLKSSAISEEAFDLLKDAVDELVANGAQIIIGGCSEVQIGIENCKIDVLYMDAMDVLATAAIEAIQ